MQILCERLKKLRIQHSLTQQQVANKLNITRTAIGKYESGVACPDTEKLVMLAQIYGCSIDYLLGLSDNIKMISPNELKVLSKIYEIAETEQIITDRNSMTEQESNNLSEYLQTSHIAYMLFKRLQKSDINPT